MKLKKIFIDQIQWVRSYIGEVQMWEKAVSLTFKVNLGMLNPKMADTKNNFNVLTS